jgi:hypothetical protein
MSKEAMKLALEAYCKTLHPLWNTGISRAEAEGFFNAGFKAAEALAKQEHDVTQLPILEIDGAALSPSVVEQIMQWGQKCAANVAPNDTTQERVAETGWKVHEPVAWRFQSAVGGWAYGKEPPIGSKYAMEPLYTHPQPKEEPVISLQCAHCQVTIETLNDKVMSLLAKQEQGEPVAWRAPNWGHSADDYVYRDFDDPVIGADGKPSPNNEPLYTTPQQRKPLTLEQLREHWQVARVLDMTDAEIDFADYVLIVRDVEALYGIKE